MALKIRLARGGAKKRPFYRIVVADVRNPRDGRFIEKLGTFNPLLAKDNETRINVNEERVKYWMSVGALPTDRVARMLSASGLTEWTPGKNPKKGTPGAKALERLEEKRMAEEEAKTAAEEAANAKAEEAPAADAEQAPAEEAAEEKAE